MTTKTTAENKNKTLKGYLNMSETLQAQHN